MKRGLKHLFLVLLGPHSSLFEEVVQASFGRRDHLLLVFVVRVPYFDCRVHLVPSETYPHLSHLFIDLISEDCWDRKRTFYLTGVFAGKRFCLLFVATIQINRDELHRISLYFWQRKIYFHIFLSVFGRLQGQLRSMVAALDCGSVRLQLHFYFVLTQLFERVADGQILTFIRWAPAFLINERHSLHFCIIILRNWLIKYLICPHVPKTILKTNKHHKHQYWCE